jgi:hypothetical protein
MLDLTAKDLAAGAIHRRGSEIAATAGEILAGYDPLGEAFIDLRDKEARRKQGAVYTPPTIVRSMIDWAATYGKNPVRIVDPGAGSGRFILAAARRFPGAQLIAVEIDPLARLMLQANATVLGLDARLQVVPDDFRAISLPSVPGPTLFLGNPPYVRHHDIPESWKSWFAACAARHGYPASKLSGLHVHFFLKTRELMRGGDFGAYITSAEWIDVNYGSTVRKMLADGLGGQSLTIIDPEAMPFADALTTGAISCFCAGERKKYFAMSSVTSLEKPLGEGAKVAWKELNEAPRWSVFVRGVAAPPRGHIQVGDLFRVHRGQVTGNNSVWTAQGFDGALPRRFLFPTVTKARELLSAGVSLTQSSNLKRVLDLPAELDALHEGERQPVEKFLDWAKLQGADQSYIARHRKRWWSVGLRDPAPILCTYMARRSPAFVRNITGARHLNIAHGLYPREPITEETLGAVCSYLVRNVSPKLGRTYAGGLVKFEPGEVARIAMPALENLDSAIT